MLEFLSLSTRVCKRHLAVYRQDLFANISPSLIDPVMFIVAFGIGLGSYVNKIGDMEYIRFIAPGLAITTALFTAFFETSYGFFIRLRFDNVYKAMLTTPIGVRELICGEFMWVALKGAFMSSIVAIVLLCFGLVHYDFMIMIPFVGIAVALACGSLGFIASALVNNIQQFQTVYALIISPLFFFSGVFYPVDNFPPLVKNLSMASPLFHGVRLGQQILWAEDVWSSLLIHGSFLLLMIAVLSTIAYRMIHSKLYE